MSDIKLFQLVASKARQIKGEASDLEKPLQNLIESNLEPLLGIRFIATEHPTGKTHGGRIDTLGLDENNCPVILEYKRYVGENVINQGLFYLDWLLDHKAEFKLLVLDKYDKYVADAIDWIAPRVICIAADFTKYDEHAVQQMNRNIELIRYRRFGDDLLLFELVNAISVSAVPAHRETTPAKTHSKATDKSVSEWLSEMQPSTKDILDSLAAHLMSFGDDVQRKDLKLYIAFKRIRNFICIQPFKDRLIITARVNPDLVLIEEGFTRDVRTIGHWGTGDLEIYIRTMQDFDKSKPLLKMAYEGE